MKTYIVLLGRLVFVASFFLTPAAFGANYEAPGIQTATIETGEMVDEKRDRTIPYKLFLPAETSSDAPLPIVIFSHGLGGSRDGAGYLGSHLASHGVLALHIQHPGTDRSIFEGAASRDSLKKAVEKTLKDPRAAISRFKDIPFVIDQIETWNAVGDLAGRIDLNAIGMSGHSFGARSTFVAAGERLGRRGISFQDERIRAAIAYSPNLPQSGKAPKEPYRDIEIALMHVTGTEDGSPVDSDGDFDPAVRTRPFEELDATPQYLLVLDGAEHRVFSGRANPYKEDVQDDEFLRVTRAASLAFWRAHLMGDADAQAYLESDALASDAVVFRYNVK